MRGDVDSIGVGGSGRYRQVMGVMVEGPEGWRGESGGGLTAEGKGSEGGRPTRHVTVGGAGGGDVESGEVAVGGGIHVVWFVS